MKNPFFYTLILFSSFLAWGNPSQARVQTARLVKMEFGDPSLTAVLPPPEVLLYLEDGRVGRIRRHQSEALRSLIQAEKEGREITIALDSQFYLSNMSIHEHARTRSGALPLHRQSLYTPSILEPDQANRIFESLNTDYRRRSQCYNRALVWAYESFQKFQLDSMKVFMFFTAKYIRDYDYHWWFHTSPFTFTRAGGEVVEQILDREFMRKPVSMREWSNYFIAPRNECLVAKKYTDYSEHEYESYCYFIKVPMYFWQPKDVERRDQGLPVQTDFVMDEVNSAYAQGFK